MRKNWQLSSVQVFDRQRRKQRDMFCFPPVCTTTIFSCYHLYIDISTIGSGTKAFLPFGGKLITPRFGPAALSLEGTSLTKSLEYRKCLETGKQQNPLNNGKCLETGETTKSIFKGFLQPRPVIFLSTVQSCISVFGYSYTWIINVCIMYFLNETILPCGQRAVFCLCLSLAPQEVFSFFCICANSLTFIVWVYLDFLNETILPGAWGLSSVFLWRPNLFVLKISSLTSPNLPRKRESLSKKML